MAEEIDDDAEMSAAFEAARNAPPVLDEEPPADDAPIIDPPTVDAPPVDAPPADDAPPAATNYAEYLKQVSEGLIDSEDGFKSALTKVKGYDSLETRAKELEAQIPTFKNEESKRLYELWASGDKDAVTKYIQETTKDYKTMSDLDVRREALKHEHPNWSAAEVDLEIRGTYGDELVKIDLTDIEQKDDLGAWTDEYKAAVAHNKEVERNSLLLQRDARDDRHKLIDLQSKIELPEIKKAEAAPVPSGPTEAEIAEANAKWAKSVEALPKLPALKQTIDDKEVAYDFSEAEQTAITEEMKNFNIVNFGKEQGWYKEDGSVNAERLREDVQKLKHFDKIVKSYATQIKTDATKDVLKVIKNIDDKGRPPMDDSVASFEDAYYRAKDAANKRSA